MPHRRLFAVIALACAIAACTATPPAETTRASGVPATDAPTSTGAPTATGAPSATDGPASPDPATTAGPASTPPPDEPLAELPEPELTTAEDVALYLYNPDFAEVAVVSMLDQLGIGIYRADGTAIRAGEERSDSDLYLYEAEVHALIDMLLDMDREDAWISFADFHAALADLGFEGSAEDLASAYQESYAAEPAAPISQFVGFVDTQAPLSRFAAWLLIVDGFVPESGGGQAIAAVGSASAGLIAQAGRSRRVARNRVQQVSSSPLAADPLVVAHVALIAATMSVRVWASPTFAHEGHGGSGPTIGLTARVHSAATSFRSPFTGNVLVPVATVPAGVPLNWEMSDEFYAHGAPTRTEFTTDANGQAFVDWVVKTEAADGQGYVTSESGTAVATVRASDVFNVLYGIPALGALLPHELRGQTSVVFEWHEPEAMAIVLKNHYDVTLNGGPLTGGTAGVGDDEFSGVLALQDDGTYQGIVTGSAVGQQDSQFLGQACTSRWNATQKLLVVAGNDPGAQFGDFTFTFFPIEAPRGSTGRGRCPPTRWRYNGIAYAPYNDFNIHQAEAGLGLTIVLPQKPGGSFRVPVPDIPGSGIQIHDSYWDIDIQFLEP